MGTKSFVMSGYKLRRHHGLTLIEVVVASGILMVAIVPMLRCLTRVHMASITIDHKSMSLIYAQAKLDEVKAKSVYNFQNSGSSFSETDVLFGDNYYCSVSDDQGEPLKRVTVSCGYDDNGNSTLDNKEIQVNISTLLARRWGS